MTRLAFLGTPEAAVPSLRLLAGSYDIISVFTQPDRPGGRGRAVRRSPVGVAADELSIPVSQPEDKETLTASLEALAPIDIAVVVAYGRILTPQMLTTTDLGFINLHFSLLPRWRGASPVQRAIMAGDTMSGVSIIRIDEGLDTGPVLNAQAIDVGSDISGGELESTLADVGARLLAATLPPYMDGDIVPVAQTGEGVTYAKKLSSSDRAIRLGDTREATRNRIRALSPSPGATLQVDGETFKILEADESDAGPEQGTWILVEGWPVIGCSDGGLRLTKLQPPGRPVRSGDEWARGARRTSGAIL